MPDTARPAEVLLDNNNALIRNTIVLGGGVTCVSFNVHDCVFAPGVEVTGLPAGDHRCLLGADATPLAFEADGVPERIGDISSCRARSPREGRCLLRVRRAHPP